MPRGRECQPVEPRLWSKVDKTATCWVWRGLLDTSGYGQIKVNGKFKQVHRVVFELLVGPVPLNLELDHLCRNKACVNPDHLESVTHQVNVLRGCGPPAMNARKTHCPEGHALTKDNLVKCLLPARQCHKCMLEYWRQSYYKRKQRK